MRRIAFLLACTAAFLLAGCSSSHEVPSSPGNPAVYQRIATMNTCAALQKEFDATMISVDARQYGDSLLPISLAYATFAGERLETLDCR